MQDLSILEGILVEGGQSAMAFEAGTTAEAFDALTTSILSEDWQQVLNRAAHCHVIGLSLLDEAKRYRALNSGVSRRWSDFAFAAAIAALSTRNDAADSASELRSRLAAEGIQRSLAADLLEAFTTNAASAEDLLEPFLAQRSDLHFNNAPSLSVIARGQLGMVHAQFNQALSTEFTVPGFAGDLLEQTTIAVIKKAADHFDSKLQALQDACANFNKEMILSAANDIVYSTRIALAQLANVQARAYQLYKSRLQSGAGVAVGDNDGSGFVLFAQIQGPDDGYRQTRDAD